jgi:membrane associated rhomboid family serine protease
VIGFWFLGNLLSGVSSLGMGDVGGVAFFAHIGGFIAGLLLVRPMLAKRAQRDSFQWSGWRPPERRKPISQSRYDAWRK